MKMLSNMYIDLYVSFKNEGSSNESAYYQTKYKMQEVIIDLMVDLPGEIGIIGAAYEDIKRSSNSLIEKASIRFDLTSCSQDVQSKYMSLTMV
jgi:hypothetical protein